MKKISLSIFSLVLINLNIINQASADSILSKETILEETLIQHYAPYFFEVTKGKVYYCEKILKIDRINGPGNKHKISAQLITYEGAHNPPYDLFIIDFEDEPFVKNEPFNFNLINIKHEKNIPITKAQSLCN